MPMNASGPLALPPPIAQAPTALKARVPAMRIPAKDSLTDARITTFLFVQASRSLDKVGKSPASDAVARASCKIQ
jgi:hypothetical protein